MTVDERHWPRGSADPNAVEARLEDARLPPDPGARSTRSVAYLESLT